MKPLQQYIDEIHFKENFSTQTDIGDIGRFQRVLLHVFNGITEMVVVQEAKTLQRHDHHFQLGISDGLAWAEKATPDDLVDAASRMTISEITRTGVIDAWEAAGQSLMVPGDSNIGAYFEQKFGSCSDYGREEFFSTDGKFVCTSEMLPNAAFRAYEDGWIKAVRSFIGTPDILEQ